MAVALSSHSYNVKELPEGFAHDRQLSQEDAQVTVDQQTGAPYIAFRGTSSLADLVPDLHVAVGSTSHPRFDRAMRLAESVQKKYGTQPVLVGHSLGGNIAKYVADKTKSRAVVLNPGRSFLHGPVQSAGSVTVHSQRYDPISNSTWFNPFDTHKLVLDAVKHHSLSSFKK